MKSIFDDIGAPAGQGGEQPRFAASIFDDVATRPAPSSKARRMIADPAISLLKGAISVPEAAVGIADIPTMGYAGKAAEAIGFRPKEAKSILDDLYTHEQKAANRAVQEAEGFGGTLQAAVENPSVIGHTVLESLPSIGAGGVAARGIMAAAPKVAPLVAGAAGEGVVGAGLAAEGVRQQTADGTLTPKQAAVSTASGAGTALFGAAGGKVAQRLGISDIDTLIAGGAAQAGTRGLPARVAGGAVAEGVLEELPQSMQEQAWQNVALDKPVMEGVPEAGALGMLAGGLMGAGGGVISGPGKQPAEAKPAGALSKAVAAGEQSGAVQQPIAGLLPAPRDIPYHHPGTLYTFPDGTTGTREQLDAYIAGLPENERATTLARLLGQGEQQAGGGITEGIAQPSQADAAPAQSAPQPAKERQDGQKAEVLTKAAAVSDPAAAQPNQPGAPANVSQPGQRPAAVDQNGAQSGGAQPARGVAAAGVQPAGGNGPVGSGGAAGVDAGGGKARMAAADAGERAGVADAELDALNAQYETARAAGDNAKMRELATKINARKAEVAKAAAAPAETPAKKPMPLSMGDAPGSAEPISVRDGVVFVGDYEVTDFDTGEPVVVPPGATGKQIREALKKAGAIGNGIKVYGVEVDEQTTAAAKQSAPAEPAPNAGAVPPPSSSAAPAGAPNAEAGETNATGGTADGNQAAQAEQGQAQRQEAGAASPAAGTGQQVERRSQPRLRLSDIQKAPAGMSREELVASYERLRSHAAENPLTGLPSKAVWEAKFSDGHGKPFVASIDGDSLKWFNDEMGHEEGGNVLLRTVGEKLRAAGADAYHFSGDEFAAMAESREALESALTAAQNELAAVVFEGSGWRVTGAGFSFGIGANMEEAENGLKADKQRRQDAGLRADRGVTPPGAHRQGRGNDGPATAAVDRDSEGDRARAETGGEGGQVAADTKPQAAPEPGATAGESRPEPAATVDDAAHEAATSPKNDKPEPSGEQKQAGNYAKGHVAVAGLDVSIENPEGSTRSGTDADGKAWSITMRAHYGYIKRTEGKDGEHVDVFIRPGTPADYSGPVFVIDQKKPGNGHFDEHKVMLGWKSEQAAALGYRQNYSKGWDGIRAVTETTVDEFKAWLKDGDTTKPFAERATNNQQEEVQKPFDSEAWDKARNDRIKASKEAGNKHLDQVTPSVETMRGKEIYDAHDPNVRGVIRTVDNRGNVYIHWSDKYSAGKEMARETVEDNKNWLKSSKGLPILRVVRDGKTYVMESSLGPHDMRDYVFASGRQGENQKSTQEADSPQVADHYAEKWFGSQEKAQGFIAKQGIGETHGAVLRDGKWRIVLAAKEAAQAPAEQGDDLNAMFDDIMGEIGAAEEVPKAERRNKLAETRKKRGDSGHFAAGKLAFANGEPRELPSYFTDKSSKNAKDWYRGWDAANAEAPVNKPTPYSPSAVEREAERMEFSQIEGSDEWVVRAPNRAGGYQNFARFAVSPSGKPVRVEQFFESVATREAVKLALKRFVAPGKPAPAAPTRTAGQAAASAAKNTAEGFNNAIAGLGKLFGGNGRLSSGLTFDEETYQQAKPLFAAAAANFQQAGADIRDVMKAVMLAVQKQFGNAALANMKPYVVRFVEDVRAGKVSYDEGKEGASDGAVDLQPEGVPAGSTGGDQGNAAAGDGNSQPLAAGVAGGSEGAAGERGVRGGADEAGAGGTRGTGGAGNDAPVAVGKGRSDGADAGTASSDDDHVIDAEDIGKGGLTKKYRDNVAAIRVIKAMEAEGRAKATAEERRTLARYVGWGAMKGPFDPDNKQWAKQHAELKELLTPEEFAAARRSTLDAHYTSPLVIKAMYGVMEHLGFRGGRLLEPSVGTGNFFGLMPDGLRGAVQAHGVELDSLTARIATALYPKAKIAHSGFEDFDIPAGFFDAVIGNPPFGSQPIVDAARSPYSGFSIHNYFLAKAIDKLRPGGIMQVVVSHSFLDAKDDRARKWIAERADLTGGARLPNTTFKENAGTEVVTDILVFQKRADGQPAGDTAWTETGEQQNDNPKTGESVTHRVGRYFLDNPKNVLGTPSAAGSMYGANEYTIADDGKLEDRLIAWEISLPKGIYTPIERSEGRKSEVEMAVPDGIKEGSYFVADDGRVMRRGPDVMGSRTAEAWEPKNATAAERMKGMIAMRDALRAQMRLERSPDSTTEQIEAHRRELNRLYDDFLKKYKHLNSTTNRSLFLDDTEAELLLALEFDYDRGISKAVADAEGIEQRPPTATKADIFTRRVAFPPADMMTVTTAKDALLASMNFRGRVDPAYMEEVYGKPLAEIVGELGDLVYEDPQAGLVTADDYLSGDVKTKLEEAKAAAKSDKRYARNVAALEKVIPADKKPSEIMVSMGASFVPADIYEQFVSHITGGGASTLAYMKATGQWLFSFRGGGDPSMTIGRFGTTKLSAVDLIGLTLAGRGAIVKETVKHADGTTTTYVLEAETEAAREKQNAIKAEWQKWIWEDADRADRLVSIYNEKLNRIVNREIDGSHLTFPGMNPAIQLLGHQKNAVWRALQSYQTLFDHVVGAGKTFIMAATSMEMRRTGIARKPLFVVPNHLTLQWRSEFTRLYPGSNVLAATPEDFAKGKRERLFSKMVTGDWDAIVIGHSSLKKIGLPVATERAVLDEQIKELADAIEDMKRARGDRHVIRDMEKIKANLEAKMKERLAAIGKRDKVLTFDELGVDALFIDEMHAFKNLAYHSTGDRVAGMGNPKGSGMAFDLFVKVRWLFDTFGEKTPFNTATGTPVSNSLVEMFNMQRYMQYPLLKENGLHVFDAWARQFGQVESVYEVAPSGSGYRQSNRFAKFANLPALMGLYNSFADTITLDNLKAQERALGKTFPVPKIAGGRPTNIVAKRSPQVAALMGIPKAETFEDTGEFKFLVNINEGSEPVVEKNDAGKWVARVRVNYSDSDTVGQIQVGIFETEAEARLKITEQALTPVVSVNPESILGRFGNLKQLNKESKGKINALSLTNEASKAGLDFRLINPAAPDFKGSKINLAVDEMMRLYGQWQADNGAQLVFCDMSIPLSARNNLAAKPKRIYVREEGGAVTMKRGTLHAVDGWEIMPFLIVQRGEKDAKAFDVYDAASGALLSGTRGFPSRAEARDAMSEAVNDPAKRDRWIEMRNAAGEIEQAEIDDYNNDNDVETEDADLFITREDIAGMSGARGFSVYDDIKAKLMARGVPEREIAFIHDYGTPTAKAKLFAAVNAGDVRFLLGTTPKMGAGTNVQKRLVGLHHIDAPWRPSDLEQREGRIIRRGNELYARDPEGFEVFIGRYATEQTYDTRRWQILEHKARGIEQLRNYDGSLTEIDDIEGEAANSADMKAAASGDPLILEETKARNEVRRLEKLQTSHADEALALVRKASQAERNATKYLPERLAEVERRIAEIERHPVKEKEFVLVSVGGKALAEREDAERAIRFAFDSVMVGGVERVSIEFRGIPFSLSEGGMEGIVRANSPSGFGNLGIWKQSDQFSPGGFIQRLHNYADKLPAEAESIRAQIKQSADEAVKLREEAKKPSPHTDALAAARVKHREIQRALMRKGPTVPDSQKAAVAAAIEKQKAKLQEAGFGDALRELMDDGDTAGLASRATPGAGLSVAAARAEIDAAIGRGRVAELERRGLLKIHADTSTLPASGRRYGDAWGYFDGRTVHVVAGNLRAGDAAGVFGHEVWHKLLRALKLAQSPLYARLMDRLSRIEANGAAPEWFREAAGRVPVADTASKGLVEDIAALEAGGSIRLWFDGVAGLVPKAERGDAEMRSRALAEIALAQYVRNPGPLPAAVKQAIEARQGSIRARRLNETAAYAVQAYMRDPKSLPALIRRWAADMIAAVRAFFMDTFGWVPENLTDADLAALTRRFMRAAANDEGAGPLMAGEFSRAVRGKQTETPEFKRWFGKSLVVDEDGNPQVMYHGTSRDFSEFDPMASAGWRRILTMDNIGSWFSDNPSKVDQYAAPDGRQVMPVYLSITRPKVYDAFNDFLKDMHEAAGTKYDANNAPGKGDPRPLKAKLKAQGYDGIAFSKTENQDLHDRIPVLAEKLKQAREAWQFADKKERPYYERLIEQTQRDINGVRGELRAVGESTEFDGHYVWVAFEPTQIKSAIGNNGNFDPDDASILHSRPTAALVQQVTDRFADLAQSSKTFNLWHRTIGTQFHKASVDADFGRVFKIGQQFLQDVSQMAMDAADHAPDLLPKLGSVKDLFKRGPKQADIDKVAEIVFAGTLANHRYTQDELRGLGLTDQQRELYRQARKAIDTSIDDLFIADMVRQTRKQLPMLGRRLVGMPMPDAHALVIDGINELLAEQELILQDPPNDAARRGAEAAAASLREQRKTLADKFNRVQQLKRDGYAPLSRFGKYTVDVTQENAAGEVERIYFGMFESEREANEAARKFRQEPGYTVEQGVMSQEAWRLFNGVSPDSMELFAEALGADESQVFQEYLKRTLNNRSSLKRLIRRHGTAGFSTDLTRVLSTFITSNARLAARNLNALPMAEAVEAIPKAKGDVKDEAVKLQQYLTNPEEEASKLRGWLFVHFIGGSVASALVNMTQPMTMTAPYLAQFGGRRAAAAMAAAAKLVGRTRTGDARLDAALAKADAEGVTAPHEIHQLYAEAIRSFGSNLAVRKALTLWGKPFALAEAFNRRITFIAAYKMAQENPSLGNAFKFAEKAVEETQGVYNKGNRPDWARGAFGATIFTFKQFSIAYVEFLKRLPPKERALALAILFIAAGLQGWPFAEDVQDLIDTIGQTFGYNTNSKRWLHEFAVRTLGDGLGEFAVNGFSAIPGMPLDVQARMGLGNLIPGTSFFKVSGSDKSREVLEVAGPAGGLVSSGIDAFRAAQSGNLKDAASVAMPVAVRNFLKGFDMAATGQYRDTRGRNVMAVDPWDAAIKMTGFQPAKVARESRSIQAVRQDIDVARTVESQIADRWARAMFEKDPAGVRAARAEVAEWNEKNPGSRIVIKPEQIFRRVREYRKTRQERFVKTAPSEFRSSVGAYLRGD